MKTKLLYYRKKVNTNSYLDEKRFISTYKIIKGKTVRAHRKSFDIEKKSRVLSIEILPVG